MANWPHFRLEPLPMRIAIRPDDRVALVIAVTCAAFRAEVRLAVPVDVVLIEASVASVLPTAEHVPFDITTDSDADGLSLASLSTTDPVPVPNAWACAVPLAPPEPTFACHVFEIVTAETGALAVIPTRGRGRLRRRDRDRVVDDDSLQTVVAWTLMMLPLSGLACARRHDDRQGIVNCQRGTSCSAGCYKCWMRGESFRAEPGWTGGVASRRALPALRRPLPGTTSSGRALASAKWRAISAPVAPFAAISSADRSSNDIVDSVAWNSWRSSRRTAIASGVDGPASLAAAAPRVARLIAAGATDDEVRRRSMEPGADEFRATTGLEFHQQPKKGLLGQIGGHLGIPRRPHRHAQNGCGVVAKASEEARRSRSVSRQRGRPCVREPARLIAVALLA